GAAPRPGAGCAGSPRAGRRAPPRGTGGRSAAWTAGRACVRSRRPRTHHAPRRGQDPATSAPSFGGMAKRSITIRGARTHNLRGIDVRIPRNRLVVVAGVSGSGKSSLVFDTIAAEAGRLLNEGFPPFVRNRLPSWPRPEVEHIDGLSPVVVIDQRRLGGNARSTVG